MKKTTGKNLSREDFTNALKELDTFVDITVDNLMDVNQRAEKYARMREMKNIRVAELMTAPVKTMQPDCSLADAAHLLVSNKISGVPVVDDQARLVGLVTEADFLRALGMPMHNPSHSVWHTLQAMFSHHFEVLEPDGCVADIMVTKVVTVGAEQSLRDVLEVMQKNTIKRIIVCNDERQVVGMITRSDLIRLFFYRIQGSTINK